MGRAEVEEAHRRIEDCIDRTPVVECVGLGEKLGVTLYLKCENLQRTGAFKLRGATNAVLSLDDSVSAVATHSSGNHGAALAYAATTNGLKAFVVMPETASAKKRAAVVEYGGEVIPCGPNLVNRETKLAEVIAETGATFIPPYNDERIIAGQGTAALELIDEVQDLDQIWVPVGGGGLASGTVWAAGKHVEVIGTEPELAKDAHLSMQAGEIIPALPPATIADGLRTSLGDVTFSILYENRTRILLASEAGIASARELIHEHTDMNVEPSAAAPLAAMLENPGVASGRVAIILSGGNV